MKTVPNVTVLDYDELNDLVNETWPAWNKKFQSIAEFEWNNYNDHFIYEVGRPARDIWTNNFDIADRHVADAYEDACEWAAGKRPMGNGPHQLFDALYREGVIPAGDYLVQVFW